MTLHLFAVPAATAVCVERSRDSLNISDQRPSIELVPLPTLFAASLAGRTFMSLVPLVPFLDFARNDIELASAKFVISDNKLLVPKCSAFSKIDIGNG